MGSPLMSNISAHVKAAECGATRLTAAGTGDNTAITGKTIDRRGYDSGELSIVYKTTLTAAATLTFAVAYQESDDDSTWDTAVTIQAATTAATGALTNSVGVVSFPINFQGVPGTVGTATRTMGKRYVRFNVTPDLSAGATDTADVGIICVLGGAKTLPAA